MLESTFYHYCIIKTPKEGISCTPSDTAETWRIIGLCGAGCSLIAGLVVKSQASPCPNVSVLGLDIKGHVAPANTQAPFITGMLLLLRVDENHIL